MSLSLLLKSLEASLPTYARVYAKDHCTRSELSAFPTVQSLHAALGPRGMSPEARRILVNALIEESRKPGASQVWSTLLLLRFAPALCVVRRKMNNQATIDHASVIVTAFLEAVRSVPINDYTILNLVRATRKAIFRGRRVDQREEPMIEFNDEEHGFDTHAELKSKPLYEKMIAEMDAAGETELLDVLFCTRGGDESLRSYVARTVKNKRDRAFRYEQLRREQRRFDRQVRARLRGAA